MFLYFIVLIVRLPDVLLKGTEKGDFFKRSIQMHEALASVRSPLLHGDGIRTACSNYRNELISALAGALFALGWWILIDSACMYSDPTDFNKAYHSIGAVGTVALIMINVISSSRVSNDYYIDQPYSSLLARCWLFFGFLLSFGTVVAAMWIMIGVYLIPGKTPRSPGVSLFFQNFFIFLSTLFLRFGRKDNT